MMAVIREVDIIKCYEVESEKIKRGTRCSPTSSQVSADKSGEE